MFDVEDGLKAFLSSSKYDPTTDFLKIVLESLEV
jgi:hypothetical protein